MSMTGTEPALVSRPRCAGSCRWTIDSSELSCSARRLAIVAAVPGLSRDQPDVIAAFVPLHRRFSNVGETRRRPAEWSGAHAARNVTNVAKYRRSRRGTAGSGPDQSERIDVGGVDSHRICDTHYLGDGRILGHHCRMYALLNTFRSSHRYTKKLHAVAEFVGGPQIC